MAANGEEHSEVIDSRKQDKHHTESQQGLLRKKALWDYEVYQHRD